MQSNLVFPVLQVLCDGTRSHSTAGTRSHSTAGNWRHVGVGGGSVAPLLEEYFPYKDFDTLSPQAAVVKKQSRRPLR